MRPLLLSLFAAGSALAQAPAELPESADAALDLINATQEAAVYPADAVADGVGGTVVLRVAFDEGGRVKWAVVGESPDDRLSEASTVALGAVTAEPLRRLAGLVITVPVRFLTDPPDVQTRSWTVTERMPLTDETAAYRNILRVANAVVYPPDARAEGVEGVVTVRVLCDARGEVLKATVVESPDDRLSEAALAAVRSVTFEMSGELSTQGRGAFTFPVSFRVR